jgi:hypothetical protein
MSYSSDLKNINIFCKTLDSQYLFLLKPEIFGYIYNMVKNIDINSISTSSNNTFGTTDGSSKNMIKIIIDTFEKKTDSICLKINNLQKHGYNNLKDWMNNKDNMYVGRRGRLFIKIIDDDLYKKVQNQYGKLINIYHTEKFINKIKPIRLPNIKISGFKQYGKIHIIVKKNGEFNLLEYFSYNESIFYNPYKLNNSYSYNFSPNGNMNNTCLQKFEKYILNTKLVDKLELIKGKTLGCFCNQNNPCHAKILIKILKETENKLI